MGEIKGTVRNQYRMFCLESEIEQDCEARLIDVFVDAMDLEQLGFELRETKSLGRNAYSSSSLVKLYMYGYYNDLRSSRQLQKACNVNLEVKWLVKETTPSYKTISEFRRLNAEGFDQIFDYLMSFLRNHGFFKLENTIAVDGTRLHGQNSKLKNFNEEKLNQLISRAEKKIGQYLQELDQADETAPLEKQLQSNSDEQTKLTVPEIVEKSQKLKKNLIKNKELLRQLKQSDESQVSETDPDARRMGRLRDGSIVGYNGQIATTAENKLIVAADVCNKPDTNTLATMSEQAQKSLGKEELNVLADCGFSESEQLYQCSELNLTTFVPSKPAPYEKSKGEFAKSKFSFDEEKDCYICPNNKELQTNGKWYIRKNKGRKKTRFKEYIMRNNGCVNCPLRQKCQTAKSIEINKQRNIKRYEHEQYKVESDTRAKQNSELYKKRKAIVEHPFGTLKRSMHFTYFLLKGLKKVKAEFRLICTCYNIKRLINIKGINEMIKAFKAYLFNTFSIFVLTMTMTDDSSQN